ncbi:hypothetical protein JCM19992_16040 [Thermostilla marina]
MGKLVFRIPHFDLSESQQDFAWTAGVDRLPVDARGRFEGDRLEFNLPQEAEGGLVLQFPWVVEPWGELALFTAPLLPDEKREYFLPLELARGKIGQLRNALTEWTLLGLDVPRDIVESIDDAVALFSQSLVAGKGSRSGARFADEALRTAVEASFRLCDVYADGAIAVRREMGRRIPFFQAIDLGTAVPSSALTDLITETFTTVSIDAGWRHTLLAEDRLDWDLPDSLVEWARLHRLPRTMGPLLRFDRYGLPEWLREIDDVEYIQRLAVDYLESVVREYRGRISMWEVAGPVNLPLGFAWDEEDAANFLARCVHKVRSLDPATPIVLSVRQPWGEDLFRLRSQFSGLVLANAFVRAGLGLAGVVLEIHLGYAPAGTLPRDLLDLSRQLDYWGMLGTPLYVRFCAPDDSGPDLLATGPARPSPAPWNPAMQRAWARHYLRMALTKPYVHGIFWSPFRDAEPHEFPHGGLIDVAERPKPAIGVLQELRSALL